MTYDQLKELLMNHQLKEVMVGWQGDPDRRLQCSCGTPHLREEVWAAHVAAVIMREMAE